MNTLPHWIAVAVFLTWPVGFILYALRLRRERQSAAKPEPIGSDYADLASQETAKLVTLPDIRWIHPSDGAPWPHGNSRLFLVKAWNPATGERVTMGWPCEVTPHNLMALDRRIHAVLDPDDGGTGGAA
jgi:hypothetical protein